jgi:hypothetical protein
MAVNSGDERNRNAKSSRPALCCLEPIQSKRDSSQRECSDEPSIAPQQIPVPI